MPVAKFKTDEATADAILGGCMCSVRDQIADAIAAERERCAKVADQIAINAERRAAGHTNAEAKQAAYDKMQAAQEVAAFIRDGRKALWG